MKKDCLKSQNRLFKQSFLCMEWEKALEERSHFIYFSDGV